MFDRFLTYARARRALRLRHFEAVLRHLEDPRVHGDRRAEDLRAVALHGILERARRRRDEGQLQAAMADARAILQAEPESAEAEALCGALEQLLAEQRGRADAARELRARARTLAEQGGLCEARRLCDQAAGIEPDHPELAAVARILDSRSRGEQDDLAALQTAVQHRDVAEARRLLVRLGATEAQDVARECAGALQLLAEHHGRRLAAEPQNAAVLDAIAADRAVYPGLLGSLDEILARRSAVERQRIGAELAAGRHAQAIRIWREAHPLLRDLGEMAAGADGLQALAEGLDAEARGDLGRALDGFERAAKRLGVAGLRIAVDRLAAADAAAREDLARARDLAAAGRLLAAREQLVATLEKWPMHEPVRRQVEIFDQQAKERDDRLQRARALAGEGRLAGASALLLGIAGDGEEGREAQLLLKDVNRRMDLAAEGLAQVRRAVHGQASASREGLRHCVARLEEIGKLQADLEAVGQLRAALLAEIRGLDAVQGLDRSLAADDPEAAAQQASDLAAVRAEMLRSDRLDARLLDLADRVLHKVEALRHGAQLSAAAGWLRVVRSAGGDHDALAGRIEPLARAITAEQERAAAKLAELDESGVSRWPDHAEDLLGEVRTLWADCPRLHKLEAKVLALRCHATAAAEAEQLTGQGDLRGARERLAAMPPTPGFLRTRIFDIKQGLARAQGLDQGFLLRVDEGGEYLVLRDDSISIGNLREGKADLRILANIAGVHARLQRSLSFHGGLEDKIVAADGEVFVNDRRVDAAVLRSGDRVRLGSALEIRYRVPSQRSVTAMLQLKSGFQIAGTDKILLLKDRGRDGRILVGRAEDVHVRVPHDAVEVEVFGAGDGQIRVRCPDGEIGGQPFRGEHPVTAGAWVRCGITQFVLQPWQRDA